MKELLMGYQGEMTLKGLNRRNFEQTLLKTLRRKIAAFGEFTVSASQSTVYIVPKTEECNADAAFEVLCRTFGIVTASRAVVVEKDFDVIKVTAAEYLKNEITTAKTFKVVAKRADKTFPLDSMEIGKELGGYLLSEFPHLKVDVKEPQLIVMVEIREQGAYIHGGKVQAAGGLPVSTSGKAAIMLSGGIDSPVAAYMMAKRGLALTSVHFASPPYTSERAKQKVVTLSQKIQPYIGNHKLYVVPFTDVQVYIRDNAPEEIFTVLLRRSMMRITEQICNRTGCLAIVTGESLAQVASQTVQALACTDVAANLPVLRPLIGLDKNEIMKIAREIDTYDTSILPYEDCCTIFTPAHPKTKPTLEEILRAESAMQLAELEKIAADDAEAIRIRQEEV